MFKKSYNYILPLFLIFTESNIYAGGEESSIQQEPFTQDKTKQVTLKPSGLYRRPLPVLNRPKSPGFSPYLKDPREKREPIRLRKKQKNTHLELPTNNNYLNKAFPKTFNTYYSSIKQDLMAKGFLDKDLNEILQLWSELSVQLIKHHNQKQYIRKRTRMLFSSICTGSLSQNSIYKLIHKENQTLQSKLDTSPRTSSLYKKINRQTKKDYWRKEIRELIEIYTHHDSFEYKSTPSCLTRYNSREELQNPEEKIDSDNSPFYWPSLQNPEEKTDSQALTKLRSQAPATNWL